ncbi:SIMPL domain-containing protein [Patescibacteria group bacterium]|nr:SIMPL domain-containing protein [Patescibacteria group bacterium]MBU1885624.1 SIMPL domain-containing protein [Patescibacteria group bacterium]
MPLPTQPTINPQASVSASSAQSPALDPAFTTPPISPLPERPSSMFSSPNLLALTFYQKFWMAFATIIMLVLVVGYFPRLLIKPTQITSIGVGKVDFKPDEISMVVTKVTTGVNSTQVITQGDSEVQSLINTVKTIAPDVEINKSFYQITPTIGMSGQKIYQAANAFGIKFSDVTQASIMVQALYANEATSVSNVTFTSSTKEVVEQEARVKAVADAKTKAKEIAKASGKRLGRMVAISDDYKSAASAVSSSDSTATGSDFSNVSISKSVSIMYEVW